MKLLKATLLVMAIACTAQAGEMEFDFVSRVPTDLWVYLSIWF